MVLEDIVPYDVMQSQLFVLRILAQCMDAHWKAYRGQLTQHLQEQSEHESEKATQDGHTNGADTVSSLSAVAAARHSDPPPLDDALAKYVLSVLTRFLHDVPTAEDPDTKAETVTINSGNSKK